MCLFIEHHCFMHYYFYLSQMNRITEQLHVLEEVICVLKLKQYKNLMKVYVC